MHYVWLATCFVLLKGKANAYFFLMINEQYNLNKTFEKVKLVTISFVIYSLEIQHKYLKS